MNTEAVQVLHDSLGESYLGALDTLTNDQWKDRADKTWKYIKGRIDDYGDPHYEALLDLQNHIHANAHAKGFHLRPRTVGEGAALIHGEVAEFFEAYRCNKASDDKGIGISAMGEELADIVIRCFDEASLRGIDLGAALLAKLEYNRHRPHLHGGKKL